MTSHLPDDKIREQALDPRASFAVSAPAGSGKTALLAARYLALLACGGPGGKACPPRSILAVTYTEKAAVEMQDRVAHWLRQAREGAPRPERAWDRRLFDLAREARDAHGDRPEVLDNPSAFRIGTFHGFCASVVRGWPAEAGVPAGAPVLPDERQEACIASAVASRLEALAARPPEDPERQALERRLAALGNRAEGLKERLAGLLGRRHHLAEVWNRLLSGGADAAEVLLREGLEALIERRLGLARTYFSDNAPALEALHAALLGNLDPKAQRVPPAAPGFRPSEFQGWLDIAATFLTGEGKVRSSLTARSGFPPDLPAGCKDFIKNVPPSVAEALKGLRRMDLDPSDPTGILAIHDVLHLAAGVQESLKPLIPGTGLDYLELELAADRALAATDVPTESLIFYDGALRHALVDEAQDLNPTQLKILGLLLEGWEDPAPSGAAAVSLCHRTLFVVGDPKQSIYRFRGSEVSLFESLRTEGVPRRGSEPFRIPDPDRLEISSNFRSRRGLVLLCNALFRGIFGESWDEEHEEVPPGDGHPALDEPPDAPPPATLALFPREKSQASGMEARSREAAWLAGEVRRLTRDRPGESVGVLLPRRTNLGVYARELAARGVLVQMVEGESLSGRPEVSHLHNLLKALLTPHDDAAWAGALRAPWCRVPDGALAALAPPEGAPPGSWRRAALGEGSPLLGPALEALRAASEDAGREPPDATLLRAWEALGGPEAVASRYGAAGVANCLRFLDLVSACSALPPEETLPAVESLLEGAYTPPDPAASASPVQLMTIHQAKGLEFDHVLAASLDYSPHLSSGRQRESLLVLPTRAGGIRRTMVAVEGDRRTGLKSLSWEILRELNKRREAAEAKRLLYVACTRARTSLALSAVARLAAPDKDGELPLEPYRPSGDSPLALLLRAATVEGGVRPDFAKLGLRVLTDPEPGGPLEVPRREAIPVPGAAAPFPAAPLPYRIRAASEEAEPGEGTAPELGAEASRDRSEPGWRAYGVVLHRALESLARGRPLPPPEAAAAALRSEGHPARDPLPDARRLLSEARAAWDDPEFAALREGAQLYPEFPLEGYDGRGTVTAGRIDLLLVRPGEAVIVDYKAARPPRGSDPASFLHHMTALHGPQLRSYAEMVEGLPECGGRKCRSLLVLPGLGEGRIIAP